MGLFASSLCITALAPFISVLILAQAIAGLAAGVALPSIYGLAAEIAVQGRESETLGKVLTGWTLSLVFGVTFSALLTDLVHWRAVFGFFAGVTLILTVLLVQARRDRTEHRSQSTMRSPLRALKIPGLPPLLIFVAAYMAAFYGLYAFLGTHLTQALGFSTSFTGLSALAYGIGFGAIAPLDRLIDRYGQVQMAPIIFTSLLLAYVGMAVVAIEGYLIIAMCLVWGAANHLGLNLLVGTLTAIQPDRRATILGLYSAVTYASMFAGTLVFKPIFEQHGFGWTALLSASCIVPATIFSLVQFKRSKVIRAGA